MYSYRKKFLQLEPPGYLKALDDFGVTELMAQLAQLTGGKCEAREIESLAALLIQHLAHQLDGDEIAAYLHGIRMGKATEISHLLSMGKTLPLPVDSPSFFLEAQPPHFKFGTVLRWIPLEEEEIALNDWGLVIGRFYGYAPDRGRWMWCYLLLLDPDSPSARWCAVDTAWEHDLERLEDE